MAGSEQGLSARDPSHFWQLLGSHGIYNNESALGANRLAYAIFSNFADCFGT